MREEVIALGTWCDLEPRGEVRASPGGPHFRVHEFAVLSDGRRVTVRDDLGFSTTHKLDPWRFLTRERMEANVRNVVLPDDDHPRDEHPYEWLCELLLRQGVETSVEQLRSVPYTVELSDRLERHLRDQRTSDGE